MKISFFEIGVAKKTLTRINKPLCYGFGFVGAVDKAAKLGIFVLELAKTVDQAGTRVGWQVFDKLAESRELFPVLFCFVAGTVVYNVATSSRFANIVKMRDFVSERDIDAALERRKIVEHQTKDFDNARHMFENILGLVDLTTRRNGAAVDTVHIEPHAQSETAFALVKFEVVPHTAINRVNAFVQI